MVRATCSARHRGVIGGLYDVALTVDSDYDDLVQRRVTAEDVLDACHFVERHRLASTFAADFRVMMID